MGQSQLVLCKKFVLASHMWLSLRETEMRQVGSE
jgi:hypothetical protein